ncbi:hypothetical protein R5B81_15950 [Acinetobacter baumannii]|nr:hypothetical protein [Acinetobacter baumannii]
MSKEKFIKIKLIRAEWKIFLGKIKLIIKPQKIDSPHQYLPLTPIPDADKDNAYCDMINFALSQNKIKNIAITGPYGSGKSSVLLTFRKQNIQWNYLNISLATFKPPSEQHTTESQKQEVEAIEKSILQQLFYSVRQKDIPKSRLKRITTTKQRSLVALTLFLFIWLLTLIIIFFPDSIILKSHPLIQSTISKYNYIATIFFLALSFTSLYFLVKYFEMVQELKFKFQDTEITLNNKKNESILNTYLDEVLYFFEKNKVNVVIFEDLDRFNNPEIFIKLRELNEIINNSKQVNKNIKFIYAIKDDMFVDKDRAKFFDFIVPIIPVINPTNAYDLIRENFINEKIDKDLYEKIDDTFLHQVSLYFDDLRLVTNIFNEFKLYTKKLYNNNNLNKNKLLSLIIYKNYNPLEFAKLHSNQGEIYEIFNDKKQILIKILIKKLDKDIKEIENQISKSRAEFFDNIQELRNTYLLQILKRRPIISEINTHGYQALLTENLFIDGIEVDYNKITNDEGFTLLRNSFEIEWRINSNLNSSSYQPTIKNENELKFKFKTIELEVDKLKSYESREKNIINKLEVNQAKLLDKINSLTYQKNSIEYSTLKDLIDIYNENKILNRGIQSQLLQFLIREGFIDEHYPDYISFFRNSVISLQERDYALSVLNHVNTDFNIKIAQKNIKKLFDRYLTSKQFTHSSILNFDIVDHVIKNKNLLTDHFKNLFILLSNEENRTKEFITAYIDRGANPSDFANAIISYWDNFFEYLLTSMTEVQLEDYLYKLLASITDENIINLNKNNHFKKYISSKEDFIIFIKRVYNNNQDRILDFLSILSPIFNFLKCDQEDIALFNKICEKEYFSFNKAMILQITILNNDSKYYNEIQVNFESMPYGIVQKFSPEYLKIQVDKSLNHYFEEVFIPSSQNLAENSDNFTKLLNAENLSKAHKEWLIENNKVRINLITDIHIGELWKLLLMNNRIEPSWDSLIEYYKNNEEVLDSTIIDYINLPENHESLKKQEISESSSKQKIPDITDKFEIQLIESNLLNDSAYEVVLSIRANNYNSIDLTSLSKSRISQLIQKGVLQLTIENIKNLRIISIDFVRDLLIKNLSEDCIELDEDLDLTTDEFEAILLSQKLENSKKMIIVEKLGINFYKKTMIKLAINDIFKKAQLPLPIEYIYGFFEGSYPINRKIEIIISQISHLDNSSITSLLNLLDEPYNLIPNLGNHTLDYTDLNNELCLALKSISYINSYRVRKKAFINSKITFTTIS